MDYEKAYKEALERARKANKTIKNLINIKQTDIQDKIEYIFPELAESEDERIRKEITELVMQPSWKTEQEFHRRKEMVAWLEKQGEPQDKGEISDGYHTFNELYYYRMLYNAAFFNMLPKEWVHKSKKHHDGEKCFGGGWFIVMANLPTGQISNHYELKDWDLFQIPEKEVADEWDGHTPQEASKRLYKYLLEKQGERKSDDSYCKEQCKGFKETGKCFADGECKAKRETERKLAWSEEDEHRRKDAMYFLETAKKHYASTVELDACIDWLKSIKPQNHWKPTDEQMEALNDAINCYHGNYCVTLESLYNDLKKL